jgi:anti-sigma regulatory factor (Ser/Thr protein kinase)
LAAGVERRSVRDHLTDVGAAIAWADAIAERACLTERLRHDLQVCLEEALANLIMHGVCDGEKDITLDIAINEGAAELRVSDRCTPFDVTEAPLGALDIDRPGGAGLRLLRAFASELRYESRDGRNVLTIILRNG